MKCKYEGEGRYADRCMGTKEIDPCPGYDKCSHFKPNFKTNGDNIRSMTDEELAGFLSDFNLCKKPPVFEKRNISFYKSVFDWLKQPFGGSADEV